MTRRERTLIAAGLLIGGIVAASILVGRQYVLSHQEPTAAAAEATVDKSSAVPDTPLNPDSAPSVELSEQEQKAIGVETAKVKRQTIRKGNRFILQLRVASLPILPSSG